jgi:hypothetical protein
MKQPVNLLLRLFEFELRWTTTRICGRELGEGVCMVQLDYKCERCSAMRLGATPSTIATTECWSPSDVSRALKCGDPAYHCML